MYDSPFSPPKPTRGEGLRELLAMGVEAIYVWLTQPEYIVAYRRLTPTGEESSLGARVGLIMLHRPFSHTLLSGVNGDVWIIYQPGHPRKGDSPYPFVVWPQPDNVRPPKRATNERGSYTVFGKMICHIMLELTPDQPKLGRYQRTSETPLIEWEFLATTSYWKARAWLDEHKAH
jgi:hypothetical protein